MNLINKPITHRTFGEGRVLSVEQGRISVQFSDEVGQKRFSYPEAFSLYLKMGAPKAQDFVNGELKQRLDERSQQTILRTQERLEKERLLAEEKAALKKTAAKKTTRKKV